jgi:hypothetical protein
MAVPLFDQAVLNRDLDGLGAIPGLQLFEHRGDVVLDGSLGDEQVNGDLAVAHPRDEAVQRTAVSRAVSSRPHRGRAAHVFGPPGQSPSMRSRDRGSNPRRSLYGWPRTGGRARHPW